MIPQEDEVRIIAESVEGDPSRFEIDLPNALTLDDTWTVALLEIAVNSDLKVFREGVDTVEIYRGEPAVDGVPQNLLDSPIGLTNYFPSVNELLSVGKKTLHELLHRLHDKQDPIFDSPKAGLLRRGMPLLLARFLEIQNDSKERLWPYTPELLARLGIGRARTELPPLPPTSEMSSEFDWFKSLAGDGSAQTMLNSLYDSVFDNSLHLYASRADLGTGQLWKRVDELIVKLVSGARLSPDGQPSARVRREIREPGGNALPDGERCADWRVPLPDTDRSEDSDRSIVLTKDYVSNRKNPGPPPFNVGNYFPWFEYLMKLEKKSQEEVWNEIWGEVFRTHAKTGMDLKDYAEDYNYLLFLCDEFQSTRPQDPLSHHFLEMLDNRWRKVPFPSDPKLATGREWFDILAEDVKELWEFLYNRPFARHLGEKAEVVGLSQRNFFLEYDQLLTEALADETTAPAPGFSPENYFVWFDTLMQRLDKTTREMWNHLYGPGYLSRLFPLHKHLGVSPRKFMEMREDLLKLARELQTVRGDSKLTDGLLEMLGLVHEEFPAQLGTRMISNYKLLKRVKGLCSERDWREAWNYLYERGFNLRFREVARLLGMSELSFFKEYDRVLKRVRSLNGPRRISSRKETLPRFRIGNYLSWFRRLEHETGETQDVLWRELYQEKRGLDSLHRLSGLNLIDFVRSYSRLWRISLDERTMDEGYVPGSFLLLLQYNDNLAPPPLTNVEWMKEMATELGRDVTSIWRSLYQSKEIAKNFVHFADSLGWDEVSFFYDYDALLTLANQKKRSDRLPQRYTIDVSGDLERITGNFETVFLYSDRKVTVCVGEGEEVRLGGRLADVYSLPKLMKSGEIHVSTHCVDPFIDNRTFYLYSDVTREILLGERHFPVLAAIPLSSHVRFLRPVHLKLNKNHIVHIKLALFNEIGERVAFENNNPSIIKLLFRRSKHGSPV